jgi:hypothetical protein
MYNIETKIKIDKTPVKARVIRKRTYVARGRC